MHRVQQSVPKKLSVPASEVNPGPTHTRPHCVGECPLYPSNGLHNWNDVLELFPAYHHEPHFIARATSKKIKCSLIRLIPPRAHFMSFYCCWDIVELLYFSNTAPKDPAKHHISSQFFCFLPQSQWLTLAVASSLTPQCPSGWQEQWTIKQREYRSVTGIYSI